MAIDAHCILENRMMLVEIEKLLVIKNVLDEEDIC